MPITSSLFAASLPMIFYLLIIWKMDKYEREPFTNVLIHFLWGTFGATILAISVSLIADFFSFYLRNNSHLIHTVIYAPIIEEIVKGLFLFFSVRSKQFDNITDGLVYGAAIGLGFGMMENFIYFITYGTSLSSWIYIVIIRSLFSAVMHCISTATLGAFLGMAKFSKGTLATVLQVIGLLLAMLFHFMWNASVSFEETYYLGFLFMIVLISCFIIVYKISLYNEEKIIETELREESKMGVLPETHAKILSSHLRFRKGWIDEKIRKLYSRYAVRLAFSKDQSKKVNDSKRKFYEIEIEKNREAIRSLLSNNFIES